MTKPSMSSCTSALISANTASNEDIEYCDIQLNKQISINDVVAVKNSHCYFKIGKVNEIKERDISITLFNYKLHTKSEHIVEHDVLLNFGNIGSKTMFEIPDEKQNILINRVFELDANFNSLIHLLTDNKQKEEMIAHMEEKIVDIFVKLMVLDNPAQLMKEFMDNQSMEFGKTVGCIMNHLEQIENQAKIEQLAEFIGQSCYTNRSLKYINDQTISLGHHEENSLKKRFIKMVLTQTGYLIAKMDITARENSFLTDYALLSAMAMSW